MPYMMDAVAVSLFPPTLQIYITLYNQIVILAGIYGNLWHISCDLIW